jgi:hypothetical protein
MFELKRLYRFCIRDTAIAKERQVEVMYASKNEAYVQAIKIIGFIEHGSIVLVYDDTNTLVYSAAKDSKSACDTFCNTLADCKFIYHYVAVFEDMHLDGIIETNVPISKETYTEIKESIITKSPSISCRGNATYLSPYLDIKHLNLLTVE